MNQRSPKRVALIPVTRLRSGAFVKRPQEPQALTISRYLCRICGVNSSSEVRFSKLAGVKANSLEEVCEIDKESRGIAEEFIKR